MRITGIQNPQNSNVRGKSVVVMAGTGSNGGEAMVAACRSHYFGRVATFYLTTDDEDRFSTPPVAKHQLEFLLKCMAVKITSAILPKKERS
jgi:NAD(P)H-hydrate repair Nnr-like enzyme with NAD(P)H-hydrate epimerase domain